jgi:hypothetical protein
MTTEIGIHPEDGLRFEVKLYPEKDSCHEFYTVEIIAGDTVVRIFMQDCECFADVCNKLDGMTIR